MDVQQRLQKEKMQGVRSKHKATNAQCYLVQQLRKIGYCNLIAVGLASECLRSARHGGASKEKKDQQPHRDRKAESASKE